jgi:hypothetical protein
MTTPRKRARAHVKHDLHRGAVLVNAGDHGTGVKVGVGLGGHLALQVTPRPSKGYGHNVVQVQLSLYDAHGQPLGHSEILGRRMPQLAWFFLDTTTGEAWQDNDYRERAQS